MRHDCLVVLRFQEPLKSNLNSCLYCYVLPEFLLISSFQKYLIFIIIFFHQCVNIALGDILHIIGDLVHRVGVNLPSKLNLRLHLVPFGHGNISHIIGDSHNTDVAALNHAHCRAHPGTNLLLDICVLPVSHDDLALHTETAEDMTVFSVAMGRLVLIHKVHVYGVVWNLTVELCMEMKQGFAVFLQSQNPGFCRREGMHPGNHSGAVLVCIGLI